MANQKSTTRGTNVTGQGMGADMPVRMAALGDLANFEIAKDIPDPRGWDVLSADGSKVGKVHELIVDTNALRTRYIDVSLDKKALRLNEDRDVLIPIGDARLDRSDDNVVVEKLTASQLADLPPFEHFEITRDYEVQVLPKFGTQPADLAEGSSFYTERHFDDKRFYSARVPVVETTIMETGRLST